MSKRNKTIDDGPMMTIDTRMDSYKSFFDHQWAREIFNLTRPAPKLHPLVKRLCFNWKVAARVAFLPWFVCESMKRVTEGYNEGMDFQRQTADLARNLNLRLMRRLNLPLEIKLEIASEIGNAAQELDTTHLPKELVKLPKDYAWDEMTQHKEFVMALFGSQYQAYSAVYFPYEHFLVQCVRRIGNVQGNLGTCKKLEAEFSRIFGQPVSQEFLMDCPVNVARLVRHAIVHNDGLETDVLRTYGHPYAVVRKQLQIMPLDVTGLYDTLKNKALGFCRHLSAAGKLS